MSLFLLDLQKTLLVNHGGRRLLALLDHQMDKVEKLLCRNRPRKRDGRIAVQTLGRMRRL